MFFFFLNFLNFVYFYLFFTGRGTWSAAENAFRRRNGTSGEEDSTSPGITSAELPVDPIAAAAVRGGRG